MSASAAAVVSALLAWQGTTELEAGVLLDARVGRAPGLRAPDATDTSTGTSTGASTGTLTDTSTGTSTDTSTRTSQRDPLVEQNQVRLSVTPILGIRLTDETSELRAAASTRVLWRPVPYGSQRPLFLGALDAAHVARPSPRSQWQLDLRATYGEEDYTSLVRQLPNQPALPATLDMATVNAGGSGAWRASRRTALTLTVSGTHRRSLDEETVERTRRARALPGYRNTEGPPTIRALPTHTLITVAPGARYTLDRRTSLELRAAVGDIDIDDLRPLDGRTGRRNLFTVQPEVGVIRALSRRHQLRAFTGLTYVAVLANPDDRDWRPLTPLFRADLSSQLWRSNETQVSSLLGAEGSWYADPVLGIAVWRATLLANLDARLGPRWSAAARARFTTDLNSPIPLSVSGGPVDETMVQVDVPFSYRHSSQLAVEFGLRYSERAPNIFADEFAWHYRELWAFVTLNGSTHRTRTAPAVVRPRASPASHLPAVSATAAGPPSLLRTPEATVTGGGARR